MINQTRGLVFLCPSHGGCKQLQNSASSPRPRIGETEDNPTAPIGIQPKIGAVVAHPPRRLRDRGAFQCVFD